MPDFKKSIQVRWSDLDPNFHVRHSVYYDWGAFCRIEFFNQYGLSDLAMREHNIGPILFREECIFRREIRMDDDLFISLEMKQARKDFSRWSIQHRILKGEGELAATITVDGAWLDLQRRKLTVPPPVVVDVYDKMPKAEGFQWI